MTAIVDPLSREAQKLSHLLIIIREITNVRLQVAMNPRGKLSEMPLKRFYRYVWDAELHFTADGTLKYGPLARFANLPQKQLFTLNVQPGDSWLVQATRAVYDLDNIVLEKVGAVVREC